jgi:hypothetical protein
LLAAREAYRVPEAGDRIKPGQKLSEAYLTGNLPSVKRRLYQAGVRLAMLLNETFAVQ